ncbi:MAG: type II toxin-antitoxin system YafQ family toxin [Gracilibacteraceae bacterium]|nr:type II toxin-antitoxin system YafQ family toxin [Gracilibacteraceae bacterium]
MLKPEYTNKFQKDLTLMRKRGLDITKLKAVIEKLVQEDVPLPAQNRDHKLTGDYAGNRECHVEPDWLLVYCYADDVIVFARTGTHADIFRR